MSTPDAEAKAALSAWMASRSDLLMGHPRADWFYAGWHARDAEVVRLRQQLDSAHYLLGRVAAEVTVGQNIIERAISLRQQSG